MVISFIELWLRLQKHCKSTKPAIIECERCFLWASAKASLLKRDIFCAWKLEKLAVQWGKLQVLGYQCHCQLTAKIQWDGSPGTCYHNSEIKMIKEIFQLLFSPLAKCHASREYSQEKFKVIISEICFSFPFDILLWYEIAEDKSCNGDIWFLLSWAFKYRLVMTHIYYNICKFLRAPFTKPSHLQTYSFVVFTICKERLEKLFPHKVQTFCLPLSHYKAHIQHKFY